MLSENLKNLRKAKGFSQEELAARLHVVRQTVSKWEKGRSVPDAELLVRLAEELDTTPAALLGPQLPPETEGSSTTAEQLGLDLEDDVTLPVVLINDGRLLRRNLTACGRDENWLRKQLSREKISSPREVFLLTLDERGQVFCVRKEREA